MPTQNITKNEFWIWFSWRFANKTAGLKNGGLQHIRQMKQVKICAYSLVIIFVEMWGVIEGICERQTSHILTSETKLSSVRFKDHWETEMSEYWQRIAENYIPKQFFQYTSGTWSRIVQEYREIMEKF